MKTFIIAGMIVLILIILGGFIEWINLRLEKRKYIPTGDFVEIHGKKMHIVIKGDGRDTIVLVPGLATHSPYVNFQPLWSRLSIDNTVIIPERFGYGFSELSKDDRTIQNIINEMNIALKQSNRKPPYTLVGHSMGGSICIAYAQAYPKEVANIVMLDAPVPSVYVSEKLPNDVWGYIVPILKHTGLFRLLTLSEKVMQSLRSVSNEYKETPRELWALDRSLLLKNFYNSDVRSERRLLQNNMRYVAETRYPYNIPILFITTKSLYKLLPSSKAAQNEYISNSAKSELVELSGEHYIHQYFPGEISERINNFISA
jgi:pimeloyl-ACP methyl ester carboxylesterase